MTRAVAAVLTALALAGCGINNNFDDPPPGVVAAKDKDLINNVASWALFIAPDAGGEQQKVFVERGEYKRCPVGARWPDCRDKERTR